jgi:DNA-binding MarR family transcriptional regulator
VATSSRKRRAPPANDESILLLEEFWPFQLGVVANRVSQTIAKIIDRKFDLHIPEWRMLVALANHAPCSANDVARRTSMDRARISRAQQRLVDLKLITAGEDPADKRRVVLRLTDQGRDITAALVPDAVRTEQALIEVLDADERRYLQRILAKLLEHTEGLDYEGS